MKVLVACEFSGIVRDAFLRRGHEAISCDLLPTESPGPHYQGDVLDIIGEGWDLMIAHPPCTYLTVAGNKWMKPEYESRFPGRKKDRQDAIDFVLKLASSKIEKIAIENPIGVLSTAWRRPNQIIQPFNFGHTVRKPTCLWLKNLPLLINTETVEPLIKRNRNGKTASVFHDACLSLPPKERAASRSRTFNGIAEAMADQWGNLKII